mgnify:CR=1 FL=1
MEFSAQQIASVLGGTVEGNPEVKVNNFSKIEEGKPGTLSFLANPKYEHFIYNTEASIVLVNNDFTPSEPVKATLVKVANAYASLAILLNIVEQAKAKKAGIDATAFIASSATVGEDCYVGNFAYIGENVKIGKNCRIYPHAYIGDNVTIGENCTIYPHATIYNGCVIGNNCILHAGSVIGSDGFGFAPEGDNYKKIPQLGNVVLEDDVEIGANTTIDRAVMDSTIIRRGVKLDNLIQIGHNVQIGENTVSSAQTGIAGTSKVGHNCFLAGQVGIADHVTIGDRVCIGSKSGLDKDVPDGEVRFGYPALPGMQYHRASAIFKNLPDLARRVSQAEKEIAALKEK